MPEFHTLVRRLQKHDVKFVVEPSIKFKGAPAEQYSCFFKDPSGNNVYLNAPVASPSTAAPGGDGGRPKPLAPGTTFEAPKVTRFTTGLVDMSKLSKSGRRTLFRTQSDTAGHGGATDTFGRRSDSDDRSVASLSGSPDRDKFGGASASLFGAAAASARDIRAVSDDSTHSWNEASSPKSLPPLMRSRTSSEDDAEDRFRSPPRRSGVLDPISTSPISKYSSGSPTTRTRRSTSC